MKYFSEKDFENANPPCKMEEMDYDTLKKFDAAREISGVPFIVNSAYRSLKHEYFRGRNGNSSHTTGTAMDIQATDSRTRFLIVKSLIKAGFNRIGVYETFIHADNDESKAREVMWYPNQKI